MADVLGVSLDRLMGRVPPGGEALERLREQTTSIGAALNKILPDSSVIAARELGTPARAKQKKPKATKERRKGEEPKRARAGYRGRTG